MRKIFKVLIVFGSIFVFVGAISLTTHLVLKYKYDIDCIQIGMGLKHIGKEVNEDKTCTNKFDEEDKNKAIDIINASTNDFIQDDENNNVIFDYNNLVNEMKTVIELNDKEVGAICSVVLEQVKNGEFDVEDFTFNVDLIEITFSNLTENSCDLSSTFKIDVSSFKEEMNAFPLSMAKSLVPNSIYLFSTITVNKGDQPFSYSLDSKSFKINSCTNEETKYLLSITNRFLNIGTSDDINLLIGSTIVDGLIGTEENKGLAYSLKDVGATDYNFVSKNDEILFRVERDI